MPQLKFFLFGSPHLEREGQEIPLRRRKALALLAYLALTQRPQSRETLLGLLWSEFDPASARNNLRRELSIIKKQLGASILTADRTDIAINPLANLWLDVAEFEKHAAAGDVTALAKAVAIKAMISWLGLHCRTVSPLRSGSSFKQKACANRWPGRCKN